MKRIIFLITTLAFLTLTFLFYKGLFFSFPEGEVDVLEKVEIGGVEQWIMANGKSDELPVLLWLHGGPGAAQMAGGRYFNGDLENEFIVVHWDQRGAGKSNTRDIDEDTLNVDQFLSDVEEMTEYLKVRFGKEKIFLLGHSWGSYLGILSVNENPENYYGYIGVSQVVFLKKQQVLAHEELLRRVQEDIGEGRKEKNLKILSELDGPPYDKYEDYSIFTGLMSEYGMNIDVGLLELAVVGIGSGVYDVKDLVHWVEGAKRGSRPMWDESREWDLPNYISELDVPCLFIFGEDDFNTPASVAQEFLKNVDAPKKDIVVFENTAHTPFFKDKEKFAKEVLDFKEHIF